MEYILSSTESYEFENPRRFQVIKSVIINHKEAWVIKIEPYVIRQKYGLGEKNIEYLMLTPKHTDLTLTSIEEYPFFVMISRFLSNKIPQHKNVSSSEIEVIAWAEINKINLP